MEWCVSFPSDNAFLTPQGRVIADAVVFNGEAAAGASGETLYIDCDAGVLPRLHKHLRMYTLRSAVEIDDVSATRSRGTMLLQCLVVGMEGSVVLLGRMVNLLLRQGVVVVAAGDGRVTAQAMAELCAAAVRLLGL